MESLQRAEENLRLAVKERRFDDAEHWTEAYCQLADQRAGELEGDRPARCAHLIRVNATLDWARTMLLVARAATAGQLRHLPFVARYANEETPAPLPGGITA